MIYFPCLQYFWLYLEDRFLLEVLTVMGFANSAVCLPEIIIRVSDFFAEVHCAAVVLGITVAVRLVVILLAGAMINHCQ